MTYDDSETHELAPEEGMVGRAFRGASASGVAQVVRLLLQMVSITIMSRLLTPGDYGLFAMVTIVSGIAELFREFGLSSAAIQAQKLSRSQRDNLFWLNTASGVLVGALVAAAAPILSWFFSQPHLTPLLWGFSPYFVFSGMAAQYRAQLNRHLKFVPLVFAELTASVLATAAGIIMAYLGYGAWSLVGQQVSMGFMTLIFLVIAAPWMPRMYNRNAPVKDLVRFGLNMLGAQIFTYATANVDILVIGRKFGSVQLGYYSRGITFIRLPISQLRTPVGSVAVPVLARLRSDPTRLMSYVRHAQVMVAYPVITVLGWIVVACPQLVHIFMSDRWLPAVPVMRAVALGEAFNTLMYLVSGLYESLGLGRKLMRLALYASISRLIAVLIGIPFGTLGVATACALQPLFIFPLGLWIFHRASGVKPYVLIPQSIRVMVAVGATSLASYAVMRQLQIHNAYVFSLVAGVLLVTLMAVLAVIPLWRRDYLEVWNGLKTLRSKS